MRFTERLAALAAASLTATVTLATPVSGAIFCGDEYRGWNGSWGGVGAEVSPWGYWENGVFINAGWPHFGYYDSYDDCLGADDSNDPRRYIGFSYHCDPNSPNYDSSYCMNK